MKPSRAMITGELAWAWVALCFAWAGSGLPPFENGGLHLMLERRSLAGWWSILVGVPALCLLFFSAREMWACRAAQRDTSRRWTIFQLDFSAMVRGRMCLVLGGSWAYIFYVLIATAARPSSIVPIAVGGMVSMLWFWAENRRVRREVKKHTTTFGAVGR